MVVDEKATQGVDVIGIGCHLMGRWREESRKMESRRGHWLGDNRGIWREKISRGVYGPG